ncbi:vacuolar protein sorting-associated protein 26C isoform X1 [Myotis daubentonii]|uniref:vacuolar protein sorting-associated protein 26C isoform X1 n=1 Tax=Myotis daubentonii TaxID=98922 RepID=UPI002873E0BB|nr:vacuolar protein sorting-associated protein 26C isoform X1 [Myotis daubentonii]
MGTSLDIKIKRANKVYHAGFYCQPSVMLLFGDSRATFLKEMLSGVVVISGKDPVQHQGLSLTVEGTVNLQLSAKSVGVFEAFYNSVKPIQIINSTIEMVKPGKFPSGKTEIPFEFPLHVKGNKVLYETYHGVFVNIQYTLRCDMKRSLLAKDLTKTCEFIVHSAPQKGKLTPSPVDFAITPETLQNVKERALLPKFLVRGHLNSTNCVITQPLTGELVVESSEAAVRSIELQLVRVETCGCAEGYARDATEIQNIQIADGDVCRGLSVPIHMVFPRLFTCPTLETTNFKVGRITTTMKPQMALTGAWAELGTQTAETGCCGMISLPQMVRNSW